VLRRIAARTVLLASLVAALVAPLAAGRLAGGAVCAGLLTGLFLSRIWFPRAAHRAFTGGNHRRARRLYRLLRWLRLDPAPRGAVDISLAACALALGEVDRAGAHLARIDPEPLADPARAVWLNNRGYLLVRHGGQPGPGLRHIEEALGLRPEVAGFRHSRGLALLEAGRIDEAIAELDAVWREAGEPGLSAQLEAERCYDLGRAWARKGHRDYARDYFGRAQRAAPGSRWAAMAAAECPPDAVATVAGEW
jgi:tetratricopeptide (TPR) repeat protein